MPINIQTEENAKLLIIPNTLNEEEMLAEIQEVANTCFGINKSFILDLNQVQNLSEEFQEKLCAMHDLFYHQHNLSFIISSPIHLISEENRQLLQVCPTQAEAIEIVNMEVIEREFLQDEE
ncbi:MAG: hypothetical protein JNM95_13440 [Chitinophagaceae bacterium]|nr:hypothetical protein [Chitinophagaceae bacterium]